MAGCWIFGAIDDGARARSWVFCFVYIGPAAS